MLFRFGFALVCQLVRALPLAAAYALARWGGALHYRFAPRRRAVLYANLAGASRFAGLSHDPRGLARLTRAAFDHHAAFLLEWLRATGGGRFALSLTGEDEIARARAAGRGAILATCHLGSWEVAAMELARRGIPLTVVTGEQLGRLAPAVRRDKAARGIEVIRPADGMRSLYRHLAANRVVVLLLDGDVVQTSRKVAFLGRSTLLPFGAVRLAARSGAPLLPAAMRRTGPGRFAARILPPIALTKDARATMRALLAPLEAAIAADPEQWCLFRPVWGLPKHRQPRALQPAADPAAIGSAR
jgi:KDO2-lipid IV(A) lauroyltransferase